METSYSKSGNFAYNSFNFQDFFNIFIDFENKYFIGTNKKIGRYIHVWINDQEVKFDEFNNTCSEYITQNFTNIDRIQLQVFNLDSNYSPSLFSIIKPEIKNLHLGVTSLDSNIYSKIFNDIVHKFKLKSVYDTRLLRVKNVAERDYLEEALKSKNSGAFRGAVILAWNAVMHNLYRRIENKYGKLLFLNEIKKFHKKDKKFKIRKINHLEDYQQFKDFEILEVLRKIGLDQGLTKRLREFLDLRNDCAHVRKWRPSEQLIEAFFEEILKRIFHF